MPASFVGESRCQERVQKSSAEISASGCRPATDCLHGPALLQYCHQMPASKQEPARLATLAVGMGKTCIASRSRKDAPFLTSDSQ